MIDQHLLSIKMMIGFQVNLFHIGEDLTLTLVVVVVATAAVSVVSVLVSY